MNEAPQMKNAKITLDSENGKLMSNWEEELDDFDSGFDILWLY